MGDDVVLVDHKGRDGAALDDLVQGLFLVDELFLDFARPFVPALDDRRHALDQLPDERDDGHRIALDARQLAVGFDPDFFDLKKVANGARFEMVD